MNDEELDERLEVGEGAWMKVNALEHDKPLVQESLSIIRGILADLVGKLPENEQAEYADDLDRLDQLAHLLI